MSTYRCVVIQVHIEVSSDRIISFERSNRGQSLKCCIGVGINWRSSDAFDSFDVSRRRNVNVTRTIENHADQNCRNDEVNVHN